MHKNSQSASQECDYQRMAVLLFIEIPEFLGEFEIVKLLMIHGVSFFIFPLFFLCYFICFLGSNIYVDRRDSTFFPPQKG